MERAMNQVRDEYSFEVRWLPFFLNPKLPQEGINKLDYYKKRFGNVEPIIERMKRTGEKEGINFSYGGTIANTLNSHRLIEYAYKQGKQDEVVNTLFKYYFEQEKNIGSVDVLTEAAREAGLEMEKTKQFLQSDEGKEETAQQVTKVQQTYGVDGVPFFVFNNKFAFSGAQEPETFLSVFKKVSSPE